jgi:CRISPR-associated endonuclease/helicase Cas3
VVTKPGRIDHSTAGAQHAFKFLRNKGKLLAYAIAGHHAGLPDGTKGQKKETPLSRGVRPTMLSSAGLN